MVLGQQIKAVFFDSAVKSGLGRCLPVRLKDAISRLMGQMPVSDARTEASVMVQGGEVLIQQQSLDFLERLKVTSQKDTCFKIVSNANADLASIERLNAYSITSVFR